MKIWNMIKNPCGYWQAGKLYAAGWYFDFILKKFKAQGCVFEIPTSLTNRIGRGFFALDLYENVERSLIEKYVQGGESVLELGACIGVVSCLVNAKLSDPRRHVVVEANPKLIPFLEKNKRLNKSQFNIFNGAISSRPEELFYFGDSIVAGTLLKRGDALKVTVTGKSIPDLEAENAIRFDTLIMDIEGGEYAFLKENKSRLGQFKLIIMENHPHLVSENQIVEYETIIRGEGFTLAEAESSSSVWVRNK